MPEDIINRILQAYFIKKGKNLKVIQRYLRMKYKLNIEESLLNKRVNQLKLS